MINRSRSSLILRIKGPAAWSNGEPPTTKGEALFFSRSPERSQRPAEARWRVISGATPGRALERVVGPPNLPMTCPALVSGQVVSLPQSRSRPDFCKHFHTACRRFDGLSEAAHSKRPRPRCKATGRELLLELLETLKPRPPSRGFLLPVPKKSAPPERGNKSALHPSGQRTDHK
jgi:hypothetical protein